MHKVIRVFKDVDGRVYAVGDDYNNADSERLELLSTDKNKYGYPFIEKVKQQRKKKVEE